jgi:hypothetical protein
LYLDDGINIVQEATKEVKVSFLLRELVRGGRNIANPVSLAVVREQYPTC